MVEMGSSFHGFHFHDREIEGKHGTCCEFSTTVGIGVCKLLVREHL